MNSRDKYRLERITRAGLIKAPKLTKRGELRAPDAKKIAKLWDEWGGIIADPDNRPYHVYRPRSRKNLVRAAKQFGSSYRGIRAIPIPVPTGRKARVTVTSDGLSLKYSGGIIRSVEFISIAQAANRAHEMEKKGLDVEVRLQTGKGTWSPSEHGMSLAEGIKYLRERYSKTSGEWLNGAQLIAINDDDEDENA
jgi:hypothetical protein